MKEKGALFDAASSLLTLGIVAERVRAMRLIPRYIYSVFWLNVCSDRFLKRAANGVIDRIPATVVRDLRERIWVQYLGAGRVDMPKRQC